MSALSGAVETAAPLSRLHAQRSTFPVPSGRQEDWQFTPLRSSAKGTSSGQRRLGCAARLSRELRLGYWRAAGGGCGARAAVALVKTGGPGAGRGGLPIALR
jgi:hypothetical protein